MLFWEAIFKPSSPRTPTEYECPFVFFSFSTFCASRRFSRNIDDACHFATAVFFLSHWQHKSVHQKSLDHYKTELYWYRLDIHYVFCRIQRQVRAFNTICAYELWDIAVYGMSRICCSHFIVIVIHILTNVLVAHYISIKNRYIYFLFLSLSLLCVSI